MPILVREGGVLQAPLHTAAAQGHQSLMALCALQAVATFDADGDGKVDANDVFGMLDKNRDGTIDAGEFARFYKDQAVLQADAMARGTGNTNIIKEDTWQKERTQVLQLYLGKCKMIQQRLRTADLRAAEGEVQHLITVCQDKASIASRATLDRLVEETKKQISRMGGNTLQEHQRDLIRALQMLMDQQGVEDSGSHQNKLRTRDRPPQVVMEDPSKNPFHTVGYFLRAQASHHFHRIFEMVMKNASDHMVMAIGVVYSSPMVRKKMDYAIPTEKWKELEDTYKIQIPEYIVESDNVPGIDLLFITSADVTDLENVAKAILKHIAIFDTHQYTVAIMRSHHDDHQQNKGKDTMVAILGRYVEFVKFKDLDITCVPLEHDLISMEIPDFQRSLGLEASTDARTILLESVTNFIGNMEQNFMPIRNIQAKGSCSVEVVNSLKQLREERCLPEDSAGPIRRLVIIDRSCDLITPMLTQRTYTGLIDEIFSNRAALLRVADPAPGVHFTLDCSDKVWTNVADLPLELAQS